MANDLKALFVRYLKGYRTMAVATSSNRGVVDCATVYHALDEHGNIYFVTDGTSLKAKNIAENPRVAAALTDDGASGTGLQIRGTAREVTGRLMIAMVRKVLTEREERIAAFLENPNLKYYELVPSERFLLNFAWGVDWRSSVPD